MRCPSFPPILRGQAGQTLLVILTIMLAVTVSSTSFIWFMNQQQTRAGNRYRALAALHVAEAGVQRTLGILESTSPDGTSPGRDWRPSGYTETVGVGRLGGRFTVWVESDASGALLVTSEGQVGHIVRRLRARVSLASPALLAALYGAAIIHFGGAPASTYILPYGEPAGRPWIQIAAGREVSFATTDVSINDPSTPLTPAPGPLDPLISPNGIPQTERLEPVRVLLAKGAELTIGEDHRRVDVQQLRVAGIRLDPVVRRVDRLPPLPAVNRALYQSLAAANTANAKINRAAGRFAGDVEMEQKRDSLYLGPQMGKVLTYLASLNDPPSLRGVIYVAGGVTLPARSRVHIADGALMAENTVKLEQDAELWVTHTALTRMLPGIVVLDNGGLVVSQGASMRIHGLTYTNQRFEAAAGAHVEVVGALVSNDPGISVRNDGATIAIRYDPAVLGTPGLRVAPDDPVIAWVAEWREVRR